MNTLTRVVLTVGLLIPTAGLWLSQRDAEVKPIGYHWPSCRMPNGSCDEDRNCVG